MWYNEVMSEAEIITTPEVITGPNIVPQIKRMIADSLARMGEVEQPYEPNAFAMTKNKDILATVLWDIATTGKALFADGTEHAPESYSDWLSTVRYLITHLDGPVGGEEGIGTNVFKVYVGVNVDNV